MISTGHCCFYSLQTKGDASHALLRVEPDPDLALASVDELSAPLALPASHDAMSKLCNCAAELVAEPNEVSFCIFSNSSRVSSSTVVALSRYYSCKSGAWG